MTTRMFSKNMSGIMLRSRCRKPRVGNLRPAGRIRPVMQNRPARDMSISYYKNTAR